MSDLDGLVAANKAALDAMSPVDRALHDSEQRRSWIRGMTGREPPRDVLADEVRRLSEEIAAREAAAFQRGAEAMREKIITRVHKTGLSSSNGDAGDYSEWSLDVIEEDFRALPMPEDKA